MQPLNRSHRSARTQAALILHHWLTTEQFPDRSLAASHPEHGMLTELVYGCIRRQRALDWWIEQCTERRPKPWARAILYVGLYQLLHLDQVDDYAAVNETVEACKQLKHPQLAGLVNAVLRRVQREQEALNAKFDSQPMAIRYSHPDSLVRRWEEQYGARDTERLCAWNNQRPETTVRVVTATLPVASLIHEWETAGIRAVPHPQRPQDCLRVPTGVRIPDLPGYSEGWFVVQDPATLLAVDLLAPQPGEVVFDLCASPGGKTMAMADRMRNPDRSLQGTLVAADLHPDRLTRLKENLARLSLSQVVVEQADAADLADLQRLSATYAERGPDRILLDVPCSNSGVIQRRPDARYRLSTQRLQRLCTTQRRLLNQAGQILSPGGHLVYSTCSLEAEENQALVDDWLITQPNFRKVRESALFPPESQTDGAYCCLLQRITE